VPAATRTGRRITRWASRYQPPSGLGGLALLIRPLSRTRSDGTISRALAAATSATTAPPRPIETRNRCGKTVRVARAAATVAALNRIVRPVVARVTRSARSVLGSFRISSRNRQTTDAASLLETEDHLIVSLYADRDPDDYWEAADGRLAAIVQASPDAREDDHDGLAAWIFSLKTQEKDALLTRVAAGEGTAVQALLSYRFRRERGGNEAAAPARTAAELWRAAGDRKAAREKAEEELRREQQAREAAAKATRYTQRLDELTTRQEAAWKRTGTLVETKNPHDYDTAVTLLSDLRALAERQGDKAAFTNRFLSLRERHHRKPSLQERFDKAGLPRRA
jgi:hypothetical protein